MDTDETGALMLLAIIAVLIAISYGMGHLEAVSTPMRYLFAAVAAGGLLAAVEPAVESYPFVEVVFLIAFVVLIVNLPLETAMEVSIAFSCGGFVVMAGRLGRRRSTTS